MRIKISDLERFSEISDEILAQNEIARVRDSRDVVEMLQKTRQALTMLGFWVVVILAVVSLFIISNTIKLAMHNRRNEINIMKYVGATNNFIRLPFVLEGILIGFVSAVVALGAQWCLYTYVIVPLISDSFLSASIVDFDKMIDTLILIFCGIGLGVGSIGSALSIRKYLKV